MNPYIRGRFSASRKESRSLHMVKVGYYNKATWKTHLGKYEGVILN